MLGKITESMAGCIGCLFWLVVISAALAIGYFVLNVILYLIPVILAIGVGFAVLYGIIYILYALFTGR